MNDPATFTFILLDGDPRLMKEANRRVNRFLGNRTRTVRSWRLDDDEGDSCTLLTITFNREGFTSQQFWEFATERLLDSAFSIKDFDNKRFMVVPTTRHNDGRAIAAAGTFREWLADATPLS